MKNFKKLKKKLILINTLLNLNIFFFIWIFFSSLAFASNLTVTFIDA